jgi:hypothetical protein
MLKNQSEALANVHNGADLLQLLRLRLQYTERCLCNVLEEAQEPFVRTAPKG